MSRARSVRFLSSRKRNKHDSEPLYSALNTVNVFLGNALLRKVIRGLCADDKQTVYDALSLYSGQNDLDPLRKDQAAAHLCIR